MTFRIVAALLFASTSTVASAADIFNVTFEAPGVVNSTARFAFSGVETFDRRATGNAQTFNTDFGTGGRITGTYSNVDIAGANVYGGAGNAGNFALTSSDAGYSLSLGTTDSRGINYFGFWLSALDNGNQLAFERNGTTVFTFSAADVRSLLASRPGYAGNPVTGGNTGEPYAFLNFYNTTGTFDRVTFRERPLVGGYESDNHTVGFFTAQGGTPAVPEPATWAMMISGFALVGAGMRRRRSAGRTAVA